MGDTIRRDIGEKGSSMLRFISNSTSTHKQFEDNKFNIINTLGELIDIPMDLTTSFKFSPYKNVLTNAANSAMDKFTKFEADPYYKMVEYIARQKYRNKNKSDITNDTFRTLENTSFAL